MPSWYWLLEPLTMGSRLYLPAPRQLFWFLDSYPKLSIVLLLAGLAALLYRRSRQLWWFLVPVLLSGGLHAVSITVGDAFPNAGAVAGLVTVGIGVIFTGYAFVKARAAAWPAALLFASNCVIILFYQGFVSMMMLSGSSI